MSDSYLIRQETFNDQPNKLIAIRPNREKAIDLVAYLHSVDPKNTYYYHSDTEPGSDTR